MVQIEDLLDKLESCVISCDNVVTYKWISQEWDVHVNTAKQLLFSFINKGRSKDELVNLEVIYYISGILDDGKDTDSYQVSLVREKDLEKTKSKFKTIFSEHIYSVQKSSLKDIHDLYIIDKVVAEDVIKGKCGKAAIRCQAAVPRSTEDLQKSRLNADNAALIKNESSVFKSNKNGTFVNGSSSKELSKDKEVSAVNGKIKKDEKKGIAGIFAAQSLKNSAKKTEAESDEVNKEPSKNIIQKPNNQKNGIANFFAKQAERPPAKKPKKEEPKKKIEPVKTEVVEDDDPFASEDEVDLKEELIIEEERSNSPIESVKKGKAAKDEKGKKKKKERSRGSTGEEESPLPNKKRRRIKMVSSSDESCEEMEVGESESPLPDTPKPTSKREAMSDDDDDIIPATPTESLDLGMKKRRKKRKLMNRTFTDEQGFIVTKKEYVFVSCSEDSNDSGGDTASNNTKLESKTVDTPSSTEMVRKINKNSVSANKEDTSPKEKGSGKKEKKSKDEDKSKKNGKKLSSQNVRQGVLTSFFKRNA